MKAYQEQGDNTKLFSSSDNDAIRDMLHDLETLEKQSKHALLQTTLADADDDADLHRVAMETGMMKTMPTAVTTQGEKSWSENERVAESSVVSGRFLKINISKQNVRTGGVEETRLSNLTLGGSNLGAAAKPGVECPADFIRQRTDVSGKLHEISERCTSLFSRLDVTDLSN